MTPIRPRPETNSRNPRYEQVATFRDEEEGVVITVTKKDTGHLTFAIGKVYENNGELVRTSYLSRRHLPGVRRLLAQLEEFFDRDQDQRNVKLLATAR